MFVLKTLLCSYFEISKGSLHFHLNRDGRQGREVLLSHFLSVTYYKLKEESCSGSIQSSTDKVLVSQLTDPPDGWVHSRYRWNANNCIRHECFSYSGLFLIPFFLRYSVQFSQVKLALLQINARMNVKKLPFALNLSTSIVKWKRKLIKAQIYSKLLFLTQDTDKSKIPGVFLLT